MKNVIRPVSLLPGLAVGLLLSVSAFAQSTMTTTMTTTTKAPEDKSKRPSPPATATAQVGDATVTINYSKPSVKSRKIFGGLVPYGQVWRTGANEATTFEVDKPVKINGQPLAAGKYALFTIPTANSWTVIFNKTAEQWGAFKYDDKQDALRVQIKPSKTAKVTEQFTISAANTGKVTMMWENAEADFTVAPAK